MNDMPECPILQRRVESIEFTGDSKPTLPGNLTASLPLKIDYRPAYPGIPHSYSKISLPTIHLFRDYTLEN